MTREAKHLNARKFRCNVVGLARQESRGPSWERLNIHFYQSATDMGTPMGTRSTRSAEGLQDVHMDNKRPRLGNTTDPLMEIQINGKQLKLKDVDLHLAENHKLHNTSEYENSGLIVRRGSPFNLALVFDRTFNPSKDRLALLFMIGENPKENKNTLLRVHVEPKDASNEDWSARVVKTSGNMVVIEVLSSATAIVNRYKMMVNTSVVDGEGRSKVAVKQDVNILFNPWCKEDVVYMDDIEQRKEYVLNDSGRVWCSMFSPGRPWSFGQFEDVCLNAAFYLLEKSDITAMARSNPVIVTRKLSALINSLDDNGVLEGRWSPPYPGGTTKPWTWTGSVAILDKFMEKKQSVKYGQCWVFSAVFTTLLRTLGIPARSVTNFDSAHDTDGSMAIDVFYDEDDEKLPYDNDDSIWNFHVWNDAWFRRNDLPDGYDGWQALDATPQETSQGIYQCGPAPLKAVKNGQIYLTYDIGFICTEVNGDRVTWKEMKDSQPICIGIDKSRVGKCVLTKSVGSEHVNNITDQYKYPEESDDERKIVAHIQKLNGVKTERRYIDPNAIRDVFVNFDPSQKSLVYGEDLSVTLKCENTSAETRSILLKVIMVATYANGRIASRLKEVSWSKTLSAKQESSDDITVTWDEYDDKVTSDLFVRVYVRGTVKETGQQIASIQEFDLASTDIEIWVSSEKKYVNEEFMLNFSYKNTLRRKMTNCVFHVEGPSITKEMIIKVKEKLDPDKETQQQVTLTPKRSGSKTIIVTFSSDQIQGVCMSITIYVQYGQ